MAPAEVEEDTGIRCRLDDLLAARGLTLTRLSELVGVSVVNLSILKNDRARAIRFSTLRAICRALECEVGDLLVVEPWTTPLPGIWSPGRDCSPGWGSGQGGPFPLDRAHRRHPCPPSFGERLELMTGR